MLTMKQTARHPASPLWPFNRWLNDNAGEQLTPGAPWRIASPTVAFARRRRSAPKISHHVSGHAPVGHLSAGRMAARQARRHRSHTCQERTQERTTSQAQFLTIRPLQQSLIKTCRHCCSASTHAQQCPIVTPPTAMSAISSAMPMSSGDVQ